MPHHGVGPIPSRIMLVGEAWGEDEDRVGEPFVGRSGQELNRMLHEAQIMRSECFVSNVVNYRPPNNDLGAWVAMKKKDITSVHIQLRDRYVLPIVAEGFKQLMQEIASVQPNIIVAFGNVAMWALTGRWGIKKWRGSHLSYAPVMGDLMGLKEGTVPFPKIIPCYHPAYILRDWPERATTVNDLRRVRRNMTTREWNPPKWEFIVRPDFIKTQETLLGLLMRLDQEEVWLDFDIETRAGHIACVGISWSRTEAICIPLMCLERLDGYWSIEEETWVVFWIWKVLTHLNARIRGQNLLYDCQYTYKGWHFIPRVAQDTMISQHCLFSDLPKSLAYQASTYCEHFVFWKDEGKNI